MAFRLGIDLGTSTTVAVLAGPASTRSLLFDASPLLSSAVFGGFGGELLTGQDAERAAVAQPAGLEANPKRRIDEGTVWLGEREYGVAELLAAILRRVADEAGRVAGQRPGEVVLTHPASWGRTRLGLLAEAAERAGLGEVGLVAEPVAAAAYFATAHELRPEQCVVVYDLGAGTFDVSVVRRTPSGSGFEVVAADGLGDVGGLDLDAAVVQHAKSLTAGAAEAWGRLDWPQNQADQQARRALWTGARAAKEQLTRHASAELSLPLVGSAVHLTREEFEKAARPYLDRTVNLTVKVLRDAGAAPEQTGGVFLVGGSSRIPLAATLLHRALRIAPTIVDQPELVVAEGSLLAPVHRPGSAAPTGGLMPVWPASYRPISGPPELSPPISAPPVPSAPVSAMPVSAMPVSVPPAPAPVSAPPVAVPSVAVPSVAVPSVAAPQASIVDKAPPPPPRPVTEPSAAEPPRPRVRKRHRGRWAGLLVVVVLAGVVGGKLWLARSGPVVAELHGHAGAVRAVAFSPDGKRLATAGDDKTVRLWDVGRHAADGAPLTLPAVARAVAFSPDGKRLAIGGDDAKIRVWDLTTRQERELPRAGRTYAVRALAFDGTGKVLAVGGESGAALLVDADTGAQRFELDAFDRNVNAVAFNPKDGANELVLGGDGPTIARYNSATGKSLVVEQSTQHTRGVLAVAYTPESGTVFSGGEDGDILAWPVFAGIVAAKLHGHTAAVSAVAVSRTGHTLASGGADKTIRLWNATEYTPIGDPLTQAGSEIDALAYSPSDDRLLASASGDGVVRLWDVG